MVGEHKDGGIVKQARLLELANQLTQLTVKLGAHVQVGGTQLVPPLLRPAGIKVNLAHGLGNHGRRILATRDSRR